MSKTRADLIKRALKNLGALPAGQVASAEDSASMDALIDPLLDSLNAREIVYVGDSESIPDEFFIPLGECLAFVASPEYGASLDPARLRSDGRPKAEDDLRHIQAAKPTYQTLKAEYY